LPPAARAEPAAEVATAEPARIEPARVEAATEELTRLAMIAEPAPADSSEPAAVIVPVTNAPLPLPRPAKASPRTASLGETAATAETAPPKQIVRKRVQAKRVAKRRRQAARIVRPAQPGTTNPFGG
jgi:hypothetical protein